MRRVLILGGYGTFGRRIALALTKDAVPVIIAGRNMGKAEALRRDLPEGLSATACFDAHRDLDAHLEALDPAVVINTCGPFQGSDYAIAETCIRHGVHYIDLADARAFVSGILALDRQAREADVAVITGASTVPGLSSAVIEAYRSEFAVIESLRFGISPGQKTERGLATTRGILSYVGKPFRAFAGHKVAVYGWQDLYRQAYPELGTRWMANCEIPDLDLLPERYGIRSIQFSAGLELGALHLGLWALSWLVRAGLPLELPRLAPLMLKACDWFNGLGSADGGMHVILSGEDGEGRPHTRKWFIVARAGDGPQIPTVPAILLAKRLVRGELDLRGAMPCVGLISLEDYLRELRPYKIRTYTP